MIEISNAQDNSYTATFERKFFKMKPADPDRMGGSMPVWGRAETFKEEVMQRLATSGVQTNSPDSALALQSTDEGSYINTGPDEFGLGDIVDMINPLQHIPVVSHIYREVTGDQIKPIGRIIGGAVFGGAAGAAGGLINAVIEEETGQDLTDNAMALVLEGEGPRFKSKTYIDNPVKQLDTTLQSIAEAKNDDFPASLLAFTNTRHTPELKNPVPTPRNNEKNNQNTFEKQQDLQEITVITLSALPRKKDDGSNT